MPQENATRESMPMQEFVPGWAQIESISLPHEALSIGRDNRNEDYPKAVYEWEKNGKTKYILTCGSILVSVHDDSQLAMKNMIDLIKTCHICHYPTFSGLDNICDHTL